jgi:hypothetical protein
MVEQEVELSWNRVLGWGRLGPLQVKGEGAVARSPRLGLLRTTG